MNPFILLEYMNGYSYNNNEGGKLLMPNKVNDVSKIFKIMSDPTRLKILFSLLNEDKCTCECGHQNCGECTCHSCMIEKCVGEIVSDVKESQSLVSHQLIVLKRANLVRTRKEGQRVYYSLSDGHVKGLLNVAIEHVEEL